MAQGGAWPQVAPVWCKEWLQGVAWGVWHMASGRWWWMCDCEAWHRKHPWHRGVRNAMWLCAVGGGRCPCPLHSQKPHLFHTSHVMPPYVPCAPHSHSWWVIPAWGVWHTAARCRARSRSCASSCGLMLQLVDSAHAPHTHSLHSTPLPAGPQATPHSPRLPSPPRSKPWPPTVGVSICQ